jgi:hypothetical protein
MCALSDAKTFNSGEMILSIHVYIAETNIRYRKFVSVFIKTHYDDTFNSFEEHKQGITLNITCIYLIYSLEKSLFSTSYLCHSLIPSTNKNKNVEPSRKINKYTINICNSLIRRSIRAGLIRTKIQIYTQRNTGAFVRIHTRRNIQRQRPTHTHAREHTQKPTRTRAWTHTEANTYTHTHTHTHTHQITCTIAHHNCSLTPPCNKYRFLYIPPY